MEAKLTTFGAVQDNLGAFEEKQAAAAANTENTQTSTDTTQQSSSAETSTQQVSETQTEGNQSQQVEVTETPDSSDFNIDLGGEATSAQDTTQQPQVSHPQYNWKEEIKKLDAKEVLKELGVNEFAIEIDEHIAKGGKPIDYFNARAIDYNAISDETLLKNGLKKQYNTEDTKLIDILYARKYGVLEDATEEDKMIAELQVKSEANEIRQKAISEQQKYKIPDGVIPQTDEAYAQWKQSQQERSQRIEQVSSYYVNHEATKSLHESKRVTINLGEGVKPYNFNIDKPELITKAFTDGGETWKKLTHTATGEPDVAKQQLIALFSINPQKFVQSIFNYGKGMGVRKELLEEGQNAQRPQAKVINADPNAKPTYKTGTYAGGSAG